MNTPLSKLVRSVLVLLSVLCLTPIPVIARETQEDSLEVGGSGKDSPATIAAKPPGYCFVGHNIGGLVFPLSNYGRIGSGDISNAIDCFTGQKVPNGQYPKGIQTTSLYKGGLWVGAIFGRDTLVTCGADINNKAREFNPDPAPFGNFIRRSLIHPEWGTDLDVRSEQDYIAEYSDTITSGTAFGSSDALDQRPHKPIRIAIKQRSYAWSYSYASDFVIMDFEITNVGKKTATQVYVGYYLDSDAHVDRVNPNVSNSMDPGKTPTEGKDDQCGFLFSYPAQYYTKCNYTDTLQMAWAADNDGDPRDGIFQVPGVTGIRVLGGLSETKRLSFNWWTYNRFSPYDFGPQSNSKVRYMGNGPGTPFGDRNKYFMMTNGEIDYDLVYTPSIIPHDRTWAYPLQDAAWALYRGADHQFVLAVGPWEIGPGQRISVPFAYVGGRNVHRDLQNLRQNVILRYRPERYVQGLDFSSFARNGTWASWIYDNPGADTDGDGYAGKMRICVTDSELVDGHWVAAVADTTYYQGDGLADLRGAAPPEAPKVWLYPQPSGFRVRFNGAHSETIKDLFSNVVDFEGYRVYIARDDRESSYSLAASYDIEDYDKFVFNPRLKPRGGFELKGIPSSLQQLRCLYGMAPDPCNDSTFDPLFYRQSSPYTHPKYPDSVFYFAKHSYNTSRYGVNTSIRKIYPAEPKPQPNKPPLPEQLTDDGYLKYYEYEFFIDNLLPTVPYYVGVTAFDFGSPCSSLQPLESAISMSAQNAFPDGPKGQPDAPAGVAYVYPNPYRIDDYYRYEGFEGRTQEQYSDDRVRAIHFANIPAKCTISIFTLDGDLVRRISHDMDPNDPNSSHDKWDLISRNVQRVVSGVYYWTVEDGQGRVQVGKLVIIL